MEHGQSQPQHITLRDNQLISHLMLKKTLPGSQVSCDPSHTSSSCPSLHRESLSTAWLLLPLNYLMGRARWAAILTAINREVYLFMSMFQHLGCLVLATEGREQRVRDEAASDHFVQQHLSLKSMWDRARRTQHGLFSIFPVSTMIFWGQTAALGAASLVGSREGGIVPLRALHPWAALRGKAFSGRSARKCSCLVPTPSGV